MGMQYRTRDQQLRYEAEARLDRQAKENAVAAAISGVAARVAMIAIDEINRVVVRPGPTAEERECYEMAQEIRDMDERLTNLIADILNVALKEQQFFPTINALREEMQALRDQTPSEGL